MPQQTGSPTTFVYGSINPLTVVGINFEWREIYLLTSDMQRKISLLIEVLHASFLHGNGGHVGGQLSIDLIHFSLQHGLPSPHGMTSLAKTSMGFCSGGNINLPAYFLKSIFVCSNLLLLWQYKLEENLRKCLYQVLSPLFTVHVRI